MEKERKGCLLIIASLIPAIICIIIGVEFELEFFRALGFLFPAATSSYFSEKYIHQKKQMSKYHWIWLVLAIFVLAGLWTWVEYAFLR